MLQNHLKDSSEREGKKRLTALQTKTQKRWRARGVQLNVIMREYAQLADGELDLLSQDEDLFMDRLYL